MNWMKILKIDVDEMMREDVPEGLEEFMNEHFDRRLGFEDRWFQIYLHANEERRAIVDALYTLALAVPPIHDNHGAFGITRIVRSMKAALRGSNEEMPGFPGVPVDEEYRPGFQQAMNFIQNPNPQALDEEE